MERGVTYTNTNIINEHVEEIVRLYFEGISVRKAIKKIRTIERLKLKLGKEIVNEQRKKAAL